MTQSVPIRQIKLVFLHEQRAVHLAGSAFNEQFVLIAAEDDAYRRVVTFAVFFSGEVAEAHVHLANIAVLALQYDIGTRTDTNGELFIDQELNNGEIIDGAHTMINPVCS